ncbi:hypothetical protein [Alkalicoccus urumqiensis]|uniref:RNase H type-1 domain-containing protein n=1 Tax=Alkalicoccus urumqiensis TaxID=1548213 RepID=A0A2P6MIN7_ALKUR|nr:hypothetical protein [Alkalicoccus urumqiensis]PRO66165.1 hypothetical protein C6I21_05015 [Alkalicoccus urumqiensis]
MTLAVDFWGPHRSLATREVRQLVQQQYAARSQLTIYIHAEPSSGEEAFVVTATFIRSGRVITKRQASRRNSPSASEESYRTLAALLFALKHCREEAGSALSIQIFSTYRDIAHAAEGKIRFAPGSEQASLQRHIQRMLPSFHADVELAYLPKQFRKWNPFFRQTEAAAKKGEASSLSRETQQA